MFLQRPVRRDPFQKGKLGVRMIVSFMFTNVSKVIAMLQIDWESEMKSSAKDDKAQESYKNISDEELERQIELMKKKRMN